MLPKKPRIPSIKRSQGQLSHGQKVWAKALDVVGITLWDFCYERIELESSNGVLSISKLNYWRITTKMGGKLKSWI